MNLNFKSLINIVIITIAVGFFVTHKADVAYGIDGLHVTTGGNVGIGTTSPGAKLSVAGNITLPEGSGIYSNNGGGLSVSGRMIYRDPATDIIHIGSPHYGNPLYIDPYGSYTGASVIINPVGGNVGIGTTAPSSILDTAGTIRVTGWTTPTAGSGGGGEIGYTSGNVYFQGYNRSVGNYIPTYFRGSPIILDGGNVGIGTSSPSYKLHVNGTAYATGAAGALSDLRHKKSVHPIPDGALNIIDSLRPVTYEWKNPVDSGMEGEQIGFIAQEVERILPGVVMTQDDEDKTKALKYNEFIPLLVKAVKELKTENDAKIKQLRAENDKAFQKLKAENEQLRNTLASLTDRQVALEDMLLAVSTTLSKEKMVKLGSVQK